jgi:hypothetical protein
MTMRWRRHTWLRTVVGVAMLLGVWGACTRASDVSRGKAGAGQAAPHRFAAQASFEEHRNARGGWDRTVVEPRYELVRVRQRMDRDAVDVLLVERLASTSHSDAEASESTLAVSGWTGARARFDAKLWSFGDASDQGAVLAEPQLFAATKHGCCGAEDVHHYYSLRTGRLEATGTAEGVAFVAIPNTLVSRVVAYHGTNGEHPPQTGSSIPELLGVLTLGSDEGPLHRVAVTAAGVEPWTPTLRLKAAGKPEETSSLDLWAADGHPSPHGVRGFRVLLTFEDRTHLAIPVEDDDFDLAHATVPSPFHLLRLDTPAARPPRSH